MSKAIPTRSRGLTVESDGVAFEECQFLSRSFSRAPARAIRGNKRGFEVRRLAEKSAGF